MNKLVVISAEPKISEKTDPVESRDRVDSRERDEINSNINKRKDSINIINNKENKIEIETKENNNSIRIHNINNSNTLNKMCKYYEMGYCIFGEDCLYLHIKKKKYYKRKIMDCGKNYSDKTEYKVGNISHATVQSSQIPYEIEELNEKSDLNSQDACNDGINKTETKIHNTLNISKNICNINNNIKRNEKKWKKLDICNNINNIEINSKRIDNSINNKNKNKCKIFEICNNINNITIDSWNNKDIKNDQLNKKEILNNTNIRSNINENSTLCSNNIESINNNTSCLNNINSIYGINGITNDINTNDININKICSNINNNIFNNIGSIWKFILYFLLFWTIIICNNCINIVLHNEKEVMARVDNMEVMVCNLDEQLNNITIESEVNGYFIDQETEDIANIFIIPKLVLFDESGGEDREDIKSVFLIPKLVFYDANSRRDEKYGKRMETVHVLRVKEDTVVQTSVVAAESNCFDDITITTVSIFNKIDKNNEDTNCKNWYI